MSQRQIQKEIGKRIVSARKSRGWNQRKLAKEVGISAAVLCHYENGSRLAHPSTLLRIAEALGISIATLYPSDTIVWNRVDCTSELDVVAMHEIINRGEGARFNFINNSFRITGKVDPAIEYARMLTEIRDKRKKAAEYLGRALALSNVVVNIYNVPDFINLVRDMNLDLLKFIMESEEAHIIVTKEDFTEGLEGVASSIHIGNWASLTVFLPDIMMVEHSDGSVEYACDATKTEALVGFGKQMTDRLLELKGLKCDNYAEMTEEQIVTTNEWTVSMGLRSIGFAVRERRRENADGERITTLIK